MTTPVLTIGDIEPQRSTISIGRNAPDGAWQRFKYRHLDVLLRFFPVRFAYTKELYPLRVPSEMGMRSLARLRAMQSEIRALEGQEDPESYRRIASVLRATTGMLVDAPADVLDSLGVVDHLQIIRVFPTTVTGPTPTKPLATENPPTSDASSPASAASTPATAGRTG